MDINKRFIIGIAFLIFVVILWLTGIGSYFDREVLVGSLSFFRSLLATHYYGAAIGYIILYMVCAIVALPVATVLTLTAGFLFGVIPGFCYTILGGTFGALASFLIMRFLFAGFVQHHYGMYLQRFNSAIQHYGYRYLLLIRLVPVIPFFVVNMVASCLPVSVPLFVTTTFFGIMPITLLYSYAGQQLTTIHSIADIFTMRIIIMVLIIITIGLLPFLIDYVRKRKTST